MCIDAARPARCQRGLTMIDLILFIVIVGVAVMGVLGALAVSQKRSGDPQLRKQAVALAESLMEEIQLARFTYCDPAHEFADTAANPAACPANLEEGVGPEAGNSRPFDNVNDYVAAFSTPQPISPLNNLSGAGSAVAVTGSYAATVTITPDVALGGPAIAPVANLAKPADTDVLQIAVTVSYGTEEVTLHGYRTRYAPNAIP